jgi:hypothetical protein
MNTDKDTAKYSVGISSETEKQSTPEGQDVSVSGLR